jgi:hypothetical protein
MQKGANVTEQDFFVPGKFKFLVTPTQISISDSTPDGWLSTIARSARFKGPQERLFAVGHDIRHDDVLPRNEADAGLVVGRKPAPQPRSHLKSYAFRSKGRVRKCTEVSWIMLLLPTDIVIVRNQVFFWANAPQLARFYSYAGCTVLYRRLLQAGDHFLARNVQVFFFGACFEKHFGS